MDASEFIQDSNLEYSYFGKDGNLTEQRRLSLAYYIEEEGTVGEEEGEGDQTTRYGVALRARDGRDVGRAEDRLGQ